MLLVDLKDYSGLFNETTHIATVYEEHSRTSHIILCGAMIGIVYFVQDDGLVTTRSNKTYYKVNNYIDMNTYIQLYY